MTTRVNGGFAAGQWTAGELWFFSIAMTGSGFNLLTDAGEPNARDEVLYEALAQIGTPVIMRIEDASTAHIALAYAGETSEAVITAALTAVVDDHTPGAVATATAGAFTVG